MTIYKDIENGNLTLGFRNMDFDYYDCITFKEFIEFVDDTETLSIK